MWAFVKKATVFRSIGWLKGEGADCALHPLIHTFPFLNSAQDIEKKKAEPKTPHFLGSNQDMHEQQSYKRFRYRIVVGL